MQETQNQNSEDCSKCEPWYKKAPDSYHSTWIGLCFISRTTFVWKGEKLCIEFHCPQSSWWRWIIHLKLVATTYQQKGQALVCCTGKKGSTREWVWLLTFTQSLFFLLLLKSKVQINENLWRGCKNAQNLLSEWDVLQEVLNWQ